MALIHFYEKPGCINNTRQKQLLHAAGHELQVHDLLRCNWAGQRELLRSFFTGLPVAEWFNPSAPAIKNGEVNPHQLNAEQALDLMCEQPILIRRPLLECNGQRGAGFDADKIKAWLDLPDQPTADLETCPRQQAEQQACKP